MASIDTRDLQDELDELETTIQDARDLGLDPSDDDEERYEAITNLKQEIGSDWGSGVFLIPEGREFEDYCRELATDCGYLNDGPLSGYVDWERWARDCASDYSLVEFDGEMYYWRG